MNTTNCRFCLKQATGGKDSSITDPKFRAMVEAVFTFAIRPVLNYPKNVCVQCSLRVKEFFEFSQEVKLNQNLLKQNFLSNECSLEDATKRITSDRKLRFQNVKIETQTGKDTVNETGKAVQSDGFLEEGDVTEENVENSGISNVNKIAYELFSDADRSNSETDTADEFGDEPIRREQGAVNYRQNIRRPQAPTKASILWKQYALRLPLKHPYATLEHICCQCDLVLSNRRDLVRHMRSHDYVRCPICKKILAKEFLTKHIASHPGAFSCVVCDKSYSCAKDLNVHYLTKHPNTRRIADSRLLKANKGEQKISAKVQKENDPKHEQPVVSADMAKTDIKARDEAHEGPYSCSICSKTYTREVALRRHKEVAHAEDNISNRTKLKHNRLSHLSDATIKNKNNNEDRPSVFQCGACSKTYSTENGLKMHNLLKHAPDAKVSDIKSTKRTIKLRRKKSGNKRLATKLRKSTAKVTNPSSNVKA